MKTWNIGNTTVRNPQRLREAFHHARYWRNSREFISTPVVALEIEQVLALVRRMQQQPITATDIRSLLDRILELRDSTPHGPAWYHEYCRLYDQCMNDNQ